MASPDQLSIRTYGASHGSHAHPCTQVLFGLDGTLELEVAGHGRRIGPGDACRVAAGARHDFEARTGSRCLVLDSTRADWSFCADAPASGRRLAPLIRFLAESADNRPAHQHSHAWQFAPLLLLEAWADPGARHAAARVIDWQALAAWTAAHWHDTALDVAALARRTHLSPSQFTLRCRQETGLPPMQWLRMQRLAHARQLQRGGASVAESARRSGYRSPSALTAALRREQQRTSR
jgi:AraC-like DNA-binding protein